MAEHYSLRAMTPAGFGTNVKMSDTFQVRLSAHRGPKEKKKGGKIPEEPLTNKSLKR